MACDRYGALLIHHEIPTALGRTGTLFACEQHGMVPDRWVLGKGPGGGVMPLAVLLAREHLNVAADRALGHYTHEENPVVAVAALATFDVIGAEDLIERDRSAEGRGVGGTPRRRRDSSRPTCP